MKRKNSAKTPKSQTKGPQAHVFKVNRKAATSPAPAAVPKAVEAKPAAPLGGSKAVPAEEGLKGAAPKGKAAIRTEPLPPTSKAVEKTPAAKVAEAKAKAGAVAAPKASQALVTAPKRSAARSKAAQPVVPKAAELPKPVGNPTARKSSAATVAKRDELPKPSPGASAKTGGGGAAGKVAKAKVEPPAPADAELVPAKAKGAIRRPAAAAAKPTVAKRPAAGKVVSKKPAARGGATKAVKTEAPKSAQPSPAVRAGESNPPKPGGGAADPLPANSPTRLPEPKPRAVAAPVSAAVSERTPARSVAAMLPVPRPPVVVVVESEGEPAPARREDSAAPVSFPAILLEPDDAAPVADPLPSAYGFNRVHLAAREPHVLSIIWELAASSGGGSPADGKLSLLIHGDRALPGLPFMLDLPAEGNFLFATVPHAGVGYQVELGRLEPGGVWRPLAVSGWVQTPAEVVAPMQSPVFVTLAPGPEAPLRESDSQSGPKEVVDVARLPEPHPVVEAAVEAAGLEPTVGATGELVAPASAPTFLQAFAPTAGTGTPASDAAAAVRSTVEAWSGAGSAPINPVVGTGPAAPGARLWTRAHTEVLTHLAGIAPPRRRALPNSGTLAELGEVATRREVLAREMFGVEEGLTGGASSPVPAGPGPAPRGFWFNINAEVIVYGATDPAARVLAGGRPVRLREDGSFSFRFSLPEGRHPLLFQAISPDGLETRSAALTFSRASELTGGVGVHPQDPALRPPAPESI